jgi:glyoxylase I family protein
LKGVKKVKALALFLCIVVTVIGGHMSQSAKQSPEKTNQATPGAESQMFVKGLWGVRYQVKDVSRSVNFYTQQLGLKLDQQNLPAFAQVSVGNLKLILSGPGASGSRKMPDGRQQEPGGWNRIILQVDDLPGRLEKLKQAGLRFRNEMEVGPGGKQIQLEDPDGNPIELFEPAH